MFQNLGDGTFHHSGSLAVRAAVAAGSTITYKLLYNSAVAMTGGQPVVGQMSVANVCRAMLLEGVKRIIVTTDDPRRYRRTRLPEGVVVWSRDRLIEAQETLAAIPGVTMLIHDQECATELRRKRKRGSAPSVTDRVMINERVCEGCGDCGRKSNCLSVQPVLTEYGRKTRIDQSSCNSDDACIAGDCPAFMTIRPRATSRRRARISTLTDEDLPTPAVPELPARGHYTVRLLGIGGSGIVTASQVLGVAASISGWFAHTLDQTGLAQKGGAVVSDIKIGAAPFDRANKAADHEVDLYMGADVIVAADPGNLASADPRRTVAITSTAIVPTGSMVADVRQTVPDVGPLLDRIAATARTSRAFDARNASSALFGDDQYANFLLIGAAFQAGALPLTSAAMEEAIDANGIKVDENIQAFRRGRQFISDPAAFKKAVVLAGGGRALRTPSTAATGLSTPPPVPLEELVRARAEDLTIYHSARYAAQYSEFVARIAELEQQHLVGSTSVTAAVAHGLHKVMAYKDEYEVARLSLDPAMEAAVAAEFGEGARVSYRLHPPMLRALGMRRKLTLGPWFKSVFRILRACRRLRGTPLDPFGYAEVRRVERALILEYRDSGETAVTHLTPDNLNRVLELAQLPDVVRGYENIKLANVAEFRSESTRILAELEAGASSPRVQDR
jgi:indolepyruvate ferredoxin oxidoreductase